jgi:GLPGLI family protein
LKVGWEFLNRRLLKIKMKMPSPLLKILNKKYLYKTTPIEGYYGMSKYDTMTIQYDQCTKNILNFECQHAIVTIPSKNFSFDVYYTSEIKIEKPNANTPLSEIPGVLLEFQVEMNGILMHLVASEFIDGSVPDKLFEIPEGYVEVQKSQMDEIFKGIM